MTAFREITAGLRFPEGPVAMPDGSVLVVELAGRTLTLVAPGGAKTVVAEPGGSPNGAAIGPDGRCYVCNSGGVRFRRDEQGLIPVMQADDYSGGRIERVDPTSGAVEVLYTEAVGLHGERVPLRAPNDLVFDGRGGFYFTDLGRIRAREQERGAVLYARADGSLCREVAFPLVMPNGIGLSPDGSVLYVAETEPARLWAFDVAAPGELKKQPWPSPHGGRPVVGVGGFQHFDSLAVEAGGYVAVATLINGGITVIAPAGDSVEHIPLPDPYATNIAFGGADLRTAYVTLSCSGRLIALDWPRPGLPLHHLNR
jgi:gluconolactonase